MKILAISVIIPVYNAAPFLRKAVASALQFEEVKEVLLIEDGSRDDSLSLCQQLKKEDQRIQLLQHPHQENRGAGASRNLGLKNARQELIAFLDADDFYLPNRFEKEKELFQNPEVDGVYGAIGVHFYSEEAKQTFYQSFDANNQENKEFLTTVNFEIPPKDLFSSLVRPRNYDGYFSLDGLTIRKTSLQKLKGGWFNENLRLHQDTEFIFRLAYYLNLHTGNIKSPIARRGVHENNRITNKKDIQKRKKSSFLMHEAFAKWAVKEKGMDPKIKQYIVNEKLYYETFQYEGSKLIQNLLVNSFKSKGYILQRKIKTVLAPFIQNLKNGKTK